MSFYFTGDPHFMHKRINDLANRPFADEHDMSETILENINSIVGVKDTLIILGDVCMGKLDESLEYLSRILAGKVVIIPGNHDRWSLAYEHKGDATAKREDFRKRYESMNPRMVCVPDREPSEWLGHEFLPVGHPLSPLYLSHFPRTGDSRDEDRYENMRPIGIAPVIHGHVHEAWKISGDHFNVGVDVNDFKPVHEDELIAWVKEISLPYE